MRLHYSQGVTMPQSLKELFSGWKPARERRPARRRGRRAHVGVESMERRQLLSLLPVNGPSPASGPVPATRASQPAAAVPATATTTTAQDPPWLDLYNKI